MFEESARTNLRRRAEDVDYWRKRAGWFDDDASMKEYNNGVYDTYYQIDDDGRGSQKHFSVGSSHPDSVKNAIKVLSIVVAIGLIILMYRVISRRMNDGKKEKKKRPSSDDSKSKSGRSRSRTRSRSRSRRGEYDLMEDEKSDGKSKRSSRSKSRSKSGDRSRSRTRSRSKSRKEKKPVMV